MEKFLDNFINEDRKKKTRDDDWGRVDKILRNFEINLNSKYSTLTH